MNVRHLAHIVDLAGPPGRAALFIGVAVVAACCLALEHTYVKHGRLSLRLLIKPLAVVATAVLAATVAPIPGVAQQPSLGTGLPDLISDPPFIWFNKDVTLPNGDVTRVMAFDGYLHNIGTGPLDVRGNPQIPGDMAQRVFDGENWEIVGHPRVQFETNDGHNHFHFMDAARYQMWNEARTEVIGDSSKVGFCLIDTEQSEDLYESEYDISVNNYCQRDMPDSTELFMGITPGWRDTYEANVTFQWVDTSDVLPGRYWVSAQVDPLNQIVESNEDNNGIVFSRNKYEVDGYNARTLDVQSSDSLIELKADAHGIVGRRAFVIEEGPANGSLDVPVGVDFLGTAVRYSPDPGFSGTDSFVYSARDVTSLYPFTPRMIEVTVVVGESVDAQDQGTEGQSADSPQLLLTGADVDLAVDEPVESIVATVADASDAVFFATDLPPGLTISPDGVVSGLPTFTGEYNAAIVAVVDGTQTRIEQEFTVTAGERESLRSENDFWSAEGRRVSLRLGTGTRETSYEGSGTPAGVSVDSAVPQMSGTPEEIGTFIIEVRELLDGEVIDMIEFTWTVTPSTRPAFAL